ncbi:MAG: YkgJ family cysteine cluster protein [Pseudomonadota bacterium]
MKLAGPYRFECTGCGDCCTGPGADWMIEINREEQDRIQHHLGITRAWFRRRYLFRFDDETESLRMNRRSGACEFLKDGRCRIYTARPTQCRTYPYWPELMSRSAWQRESRRCEGIGRGTAIPLATVRQHLQGDR